MRARFRSTSCVDGREMRSDPQTDDPYLQTDIGECPECGGRGCAVIAAEREADAIAEEEQADRIAEEEAEQERADNAWNGVGS